MTTAEDRQHLETLVEDITSTGLVTLNDSHLKQLKTACRKSDSNLRFAFDRIWRQLNKDHAQIRYSCVKVIDALFQRSHLFRQLLLDDVHEYFALTIALNPKTKLPKPKSTARMLRRQTLICFNQWHEKYHDQHKKLVLGFKFLQNNGGIDFSDLGEDAGMSAVERQRARDRARAEQTKAQELYQRAAREIADQWDSVEINLSQLEASVDLMREQRLWGVDTIGPTRTDGTKKDEVTTPMNTEIPQTGEESSMHLDQQVRSINSTGSKNSTSSKNRSASAEPSVDAPVLSAVREHDRVLRYKHVLMVNTWVDALLGAVRYHGNQTGTNTTSSSSARGHSTSPTDTTSQPLSHRVGVPTGDSSRAQSTGRDGRTTTALGAASPTTQPHPQALLSRAVALQVRCQTLLKAVVQMGVDVSPPKCRSLAMATTSDNLADSTAEQKEDKASSETGWSVFSYARDVQKREPTQQHIQITLEQDEEQRLAYTYDNSRSKAIDPTAQVFKAPARTTAMGAAVRIKEGVPVMPYDTDLEYWESKTVPINVGLVDDIDHRFWSSSERVGEVDAALFRTRVRYHDNEFVPVKWACRAPLPTGKLCARHDRKKCPIHGPVIARDSEGVPNSPTPNAETQQPDGNTLLNNGTSADPTGAESDGAAQSIGQTGMGADVYARFAGIGTQADRSGAGAGATSNSLTTSQTTGTNHTTTSTAHRQDTQDTGVQDNAQTTVAHTAEQPLWESVAQDMGITMPSDGSEPLKETRANAFASSNAVVKGGFAELGDGQANAVVRIGEPHSDMASLNGGVGIRGRSKRKAADGGNSSRKPAKKESALAKVKDDVEVMNERRRRRLFKGRLYDAAVKLDLEEQKKHADKFGNQWQYY
ncbi:hypothetical protein, variant [Sphaeroforma arctica JP610]|nr:hypothetical protein, variant [Sphaeroforma arctica JP610]KNC79785.1 hypothetical protein, variant [Sphaeroforma arctica JP610]|eukprot:XP_014153687.1 hypothetical protein, variant [Sphaeroforma arctica JP610]